MSGSASFQYFEDVREYMKTPIVFQADLRGSRPRSNRLPAFVLFASITFSLAFAALPAAAQDENGKSAGAFVGADASAKDVGLPIYPGARPHKDKDNDSAAAKLGFWGGSVDFKVAVIKMESKDSPDKIAAFYKKALAKYGPVLDCTNSSASKGDNDENHSSGSSKKLECDEKPDPGEMVFESGTKEKQHVVGIQSNGPGTVFQLVYVQVPDSEKDK